MSRKEASAAAFVLRRPEPDDADELAALHVQTWQETYDHLLPAGFFTSEFLDGRLRLWQHLTSATGGARLVRLAEVAEGNTGAVGEEYLHKIVGFAVAGPDTESGDGKDNRQLFSLYVLRRLHGTGVGQTLLDEVLGKEPAVLWVAKDNPRAVAFYRRNGFEFDGTVRSDPAAPGLVECRMLRPSMLRPSMVR
ncbi:GNAT family N-acetyltransferase [Arthrobacter sp. Edens01]|uniref:GNAT family N-acetyltransferase n=1 Tax=Arthrobacter sp. Edens01 TaxID=1732020 RepID=UPI0006DB57D9|nr:N-acetyltransferase [Arthrobacter sp. Edens01]KPN16449.1 hypothetical protein AO716_16445 [Arthrobacter sp. Edens01]